MQVAVKNLGIAGVANNAVSIRGLLIKTMRHPVQAVVRTKEPGVHQRGGFRAQNLHTAKLSILQVGDHEVTHVPGSGGDAARWKPFDEFEGFGVEEART